MRIRLMTPLMIVNFERSLLVDARELSTQRRYHFLPLHLIVEYFVCMVVFWLS